MKVPTLFIPALSIEKHLFAHSFFTSPYNHLRARTPLNMIFSVTNSNCLAQCQLKTAV